MGRSPDGLQVEFLTCFLPWVAEPRYQRTFFVLLTTWCLPTSPEVLFFITRAGAVMISTAPSLFFPFHFARIFAEFFFIFARVLPRAFHFEDPFVGKVEN